MATYIKDLLEDNGDITRPVTEAGAVLLSGGGDLETTLASKADQTAVDNKISIGDVQGTDLSANAKLAILNMIYPVGSIFMSATLSTPAQVASAMGGTWVAWGAGRVPVGVDTSQTEFKTVGKTGGSKTHTHGLTDGYAKIILKTNGQVRYQERPVASWTDNYYVPSAGAGAAGADTQSYATDLDGSTNAGSTLQPYITCYMYKRTA